MRVSRLCLMMTFLSIAVTGMALADGGSAEARRANTAKFQAEIDRVAAKGGGRVVVEKGVHPCGTLYLKSGVELHLEDGAVLLGGGKQEDYDDAIPLREVYSYKKSVSTTVTRKAFVYAENATNIAITGKGTIDGNGPLFFDQNSRLWGRYWDKPKVMRPRMVVFMNCKGIRFEETTFKDSPVWTMWLRHCDDIEVSRIKVVARQEMINSDGIDFDACRHVRVGDSYFKTGDDCLILRSIRMLADGPDPIVTEDVVVSNCYLNSWCQGVRIGCPSDEVIRDAVFRDIVFEGINAIWSHQPHHYLTPGNNGCLVTKNLLFENWEIRNCDYPIRVSVEKGLKMGDFGHMTFRNISFDSKRGVVIEGAPGSPVSDVRFENVRGKVESGNPLVVNEAVGIDMLGVDIQLK